MKDNQAAKAILRRDYQPPVFWVDSVHLAFDLRDSGSVVTSTMALRRNPESSDSALVLDGAELELLSVQLDGVLLDATDYEITAESLTLASLPASCELRIQTKIYPEKNTALEGLYRSSGNYCTQCEAQGFRKITYYLDRPDVLSVFSVRIEADQSQYPVMLSNGNKTDAGVLSDGRHFASWHDPHPKPCYLFALVAGDLVALTDSFVTASGRHVELAIYVEQHNLHKCDYAMQALKASMQWDEEVYGLEYDLDIFMIVAVDDFNMGAMENKGLNIFNSKYVLADQATATDADFSGVEGVIAHEYFHNWTGNRVTCRDWFQLSLKEGLTVFRDQEFSADMNSRSVKRIEDVRLLRAHQFPEDAGPMAHPIRPDEYVEINNFYTVTVYEKGAEVIRMLHTLLGATRYRQGIDLYFERHDGCAVTCDDFVQAMQDASGQDLTQFRRWYSQAGTPVVTVTGDYDAEHSEYRLTVTQSCPATPGQPDKKPFHMPLLVSLLGPSGTALDVSVTGEGSSAAGVVDDSVDDLGGAEFRVHLTKDTQTVVFGNVSEEPVLSFNRGFSAPVIVNHAVSDDELAFLMAHDTDSFNRWEAGQQLYQRVIEALATESGLTPDDARFQSFHAAFATLLDNTSDPAFLSEALTLPGIQTVAAQHDIIAVDEIDAAIESLTRYLATAHRDRFVLLMAQHGTADEFSVDSHAKGKRSLKNTCLQYLGSLDADQWLETVLAQYRSANNMTDTMAALRVLTHSDVPERNEVLADFYTRWQDDRLVIDKWFALQASSRRATVIDEVRELAQHDAFDMSNPNRVRSLIGAFVATGGIRFHDRSGAGYGLLADYVLKLDANNPQIAARLVNPLGRWRRYDESRAAHMRAQLERINQSPSLSKDVQEIVTRSLASST